MYGVFNTSLQGLWLHLATTKIFAWPHATLVFAGTPKDMLPQTQSARERRTPSSAEYTEWLICPRTIDRVQNGPPWGLGTTVPQVWTPKSAGTPEV